MKTVKVMGNCPNICKGFWGNQFGGYEKSKGEDIQGQRFSGKSIGRETGLGKSKD